MKINRDYFQYTVNEYATLRGAVETCLPGVLEDDVFLRVWLTQVEAQEKAIYEYLKQRYTEE